MREYPIKKLWYTRHKGKTIEEVADCDLSYLCWMIKTFQDITPAQAQYIKDKYNLKVKDEYVKDVRPYEYVKGDTLKMYEDLCLMYDIDKWEHKWRVVQGELF